MPAAKSPEDKRDKNLQIRVDSDTHGRVVALSQAMGYARVADFIRDLIDDALADAQTKIDQLKASVDQQAADKKRHLDELAAVAAATPTRAVVNGSNDLRRSGPRPAGPDQVGDV
jgi:hypothetical protein